MFPSGFNGGTCASARFTEMSNAPKSIPGFMEVFAFRFPPWQFLSLTYRLLYGTAKVVACC
jgi:hypothetical protein